MILGWSEIAPRLALFTVVIWLPFVVTVGIFHGHLGRDRVSPPEGILLVLFAVGAAYGMQWMYHGLRREEAALVPDIALRFVNPRRPMLEIVNRSDTIVRDIKWTPVLWDIDHPGPTPLEPLEIPVQSFDWLRPDQYGGPEVIFDRPTVLSQIKPGDRVYGSVSVICPRCARGRTYLLAFRWDQGGWYYEVPHYAEDALPTTNTKEALLQFAATVDAIARMSKRIPITDR